MRPCAKPPEPEPAFPWLERPLAASPAVRLLHVGERAALFCERTQALFELNTTAEAIWRGLAAGRTPAEMIVRLGSLGASAVDAEAFVASSAHAWLEAGYLAPADLAGAAERVLNLRIADLACSIGADAALMAELAAVFGQFRVEPTAGLRLRAVAEGDGYLLLVDEVPRGLFAAERIVPEVKAVLTEALARSVGDGAFLLHAALLAHDREGLLISGAPGAGKTTLALALAAHGFGYGSDDIVRVSAAANLVGVPFSPASKSGAWNLAAPYVPTLRGLPLHRRSDGQQVRYVPAGGFAGGEVDGLGWVLLLDRRPGATVALEPAAPLDALTQLIAGAFSADHRMTGEALAAFAAKVARADCRRLVYSDLGEAVAAIEALVRG